VFFLPFCSFSLPFPTLPSAQNSSSAPACFLLAPPVVYLQDFMINILVASLCIFEGTFELLVPSSRLFAFTRRVLTRVRAVNKLHELETPNGVVSLLFGFFPPLPFCGNNLFLFWTVFSSTGQPLLRFQRGKLVIPIQLIAGLLLFLPPHPSKRHHLRFRRFSPLFFFFLRFLFAESVFFFHRHGCAGTTSWA